MRLELISIHNYRNLDGVTIHFNPESNYVVGENNIGKSNLLDLITIVCHAKSFQESDYLDPSLPIAIEITISQRFFQSQEKQNAKNQHDYIEHKLRLNQYITDTCPRLEPVEPLEGFTYGDLRKMHFFMHDTNLNEVVSALPFINQGEFPFIERAKNSLIERLREFYFSKATPFLDSLIEGTDGRKRLPVILAIDEPEIHLHPYMQRSLLNYYKRVLSNEDDDFLKEIKESFGIDGLEGQLILVTHSTDALVDNHRNIIRFYKETDGKTRAISGMDIDIKIDIEKHLLMHFPDIKEAFYAKCVLIVEGETEYGCIRGFSNTLKIPMDDYGICFVNAHGEGSIHKLKKLFDHFKIPSVLIYDSDVKEGKLPGKNSFFTKEVCFEMDIVDKLISQNREDLLREIAVELKSNAMRYTMEEDFIKKPFKKIGYHLEGYQPLSLSELDPNKKDEYKALYFAWYYVRKGIMIGRIIGNALPTNCIPDCYIDAIRRAKELSTSL